MAQIARWCRSSEDCGDGINAITGVLIQPPAVLLRCLRDQSLTDRQKRKEGKLWRAGSRAESAPATTSAVDMTDLIDLPFSGLFSCTPCQSLLWLCCSGWPAAGLGLLGCSAWCHPMRAFPVRLADRSMLIRGVHNLLECPINAKDRESTCRGRLDPMAVSLSFPRYAAIADRQAGCHSWSCRCCNC